MAATGLTNLQASIAALQQEDLQLFTDIQQALQNDDPDAAVQAASDLVNAEVAKLAANDPITGTGAQPPPAS